MGIYGMGWGVYCTYLGSKSEFLSMRRVAEICTATVGRAQFQQCLFMLGQLLRAFAIPALSLIFVICREQ